MFAFHVLYPRIGAFDVDYYMNTHMTMVDRLWKPHGLLQWTVVRVDPSSDGTSPYQIVTTLFFDSRNGFDAAMAATAGEIMGDIKNYTALTPVILTGETIAT